MCYEKKKPLIFIPPQLERVSSPWVHESEECGEENLWRSQGSDGYLGDRLEIQVCQAGERIANLRGALLPGQGKSPFLFYVRMNSFRVWQKYSVPV